MFFQSTLGLRENRRHPATYLVHGAKALNNAFRGWTRKEVRLIILRVELSSYYASYKWQQWEIWLTYLFNMYYIFCSFQF